MKQVIFGLGGAAKDALECIPAPKLKIFPSPSPEVGFLCSPEYRRADTFQGYPVLGGTEWLVENLDVPVTVALGNPWDRRKIVEAMPWSSTPGHGLKFSTLIHDTAIVMRGATVDVGSVLTPFVTIGVDAVVGKHAWFGHKATVGHDCKLGDFVTLYPHAALGGGVRVGHGCEIGSGAMVLPKIFLADNTRIGAGAVVTRDVLVPGMTLVGVPARPIYRFEHAAV